MESCIPDFYFFRDVIVAGIFAVEVKIDKDAFIRLGQSEVSGEILG